MAMQGRSSSGSDYGSGGGGGGGGYGAGDKLSSSFYQRGSGDSGGSSRRSYEDVKAPAAAAAFLHDSGVGAKHNARTGYYDAAYAGGGAGYDSAAAAYKPSRDSLYAGSGRQY